MNIRNNIYLCIRYQNILAMIRKTMTLEDKKLEFLIYCIESTASTLKINGRDVFNELDNIGAIDNYIMPYYDTLHTQGKSYIVDSILEYIYYRDPKWLPNDYKPFTVNVASEGALSQ